LPDRRTLVTGAAGFIGANLARRLADEGQDVHLVVRPGSDPWRLEGLGGHVALHEVDLTDADAVGRLVRTVAPEVVFHTAAHGAYPAQSDVRRMLAVNVHGTVNLLLACVEHGFRSFVHTGSSSEYGFKDHPPLETDHLEPNSDYAVTKAAATLYCRLVAATRDANVTTLRLYSAYGPWEEPTRLVPTLVTRGLARGFPDLVDPRVARDYVYVDDVVEACLAAASAATGGIYNVGTGVQTTLGEAVTAAQDVMSIPGAPRWGTMQGRPWDTHVWISEPTLIEQTLGWRARVGFAEGLRRTVEWLRDTPGMLDVYRRRQPPV
jgi:nucleoside-diphosphate-sugar epimerase